MLALARCFEEAKNTFLDLSKEATSLDCCATPVLGMSLETFFFGIVLQVFRCSRKRQVHRACSNILEDEKVKDRFQELLFSTFHLFLHWSHPCQNLHAAQQRVAFQHAHHMVLLLTVTGAASERHMVPKR